MTHFTPFFIVSVVDFEQVNVSWVISLFFVNAVLSTNKISIFLFLGGNAWDVLVIIFLGKLSIYLFKIFIYRCYEKVSKANQFQEKYIKYTLTIESSQWLADRAKKGE